MAETVDLKKLRAALRLSQAQLAERLGCDQSTVCRMERGQTPSGPVLRLISILEQEAAQEVAR